MLDFGMLPPEITSTQMYTGPGAGQLMTGAAGWNSLAAQSESFAKGYASAIAGLQGEHWGGSAAAAMTAAAAPYAQWAAATGVQAEQAASQLRAAAAAFETAHAAITPPAAVAANRAQLANLIATNVFGHNTARIAATEAAYQGMWAQNAHAMYSYAASASSAASLPPFQQAPQTVNPAGQSAQSAAAAGAASSGASNTPLSLTDLLQALSTPGSGASTSPGIPVPQSLVTDLDQLEKLMNFDDGILFDKMRLVGSVTHAALAWIRITTDGLFYAPLSGGLSSLGLTGATSPAAAGAATGAAAEGAVLASLGDATTVGRLSAPQAWANAIPAGGINDALSPLARGALETTSRVGVAGTGSAAAMAPMAQAAGAAMAKKFKRPSISTVLQVTPPRYTMPRPSSGG